MFKEVKKSNVEKKSKEMKGYSCRAECGGAAGN